MSEETLTESPKPCCKAPDRKPDDIKVLKIAVVAVAILLIISNIILLRKIAYIKARVGASVTGVFDK